MRASLFAIEPRQFFARDLGVARVFEPGREISELAVLTGDRAERGGGVRFAVKQLLDALLHFGRDLVGLLVVLRAVRDEQLANFFALLVLQVVEAEFGIETPLGPLDEIFAIEALALAAGSLGLRIGTDQPAPGYSDSRWS